MSSFLKQRMSRSGAYSDTIFFLVLISHHEPSDGEHEEYDAAGIAAVGHDDVDKGDVGDEHIHYKHADAGKNTGELILYGFLVLIRWKHRSRAWGRRCCRSRGE